ncbi:MAG TPA: hypothetical protein VNM38_09370 [Solirubrobacterales bacterium]|nr:hypothetical protein [Solirubrobacterales bacterium]
MSRPLVALLEALPFELFLEDDFELDFDFEEAFLVAFEAVLRVAFLAFVALPLAFDFVDLVAFDVFDFAPALAALFLPLALPVAFLSAI